jgi:hypothetical protein
VRSFTRKRVQRLVAEGFAERQKERDQFRKIFNEKYNNTRGRGKSVKAKRGTA